MNEITYGVPVIRGSIPTHVPGSSHNVYGPDTVATEVAPARPTVVVPPTWLYVPAEDTEARLDQTWTEGQYGRNVGPLPADFGQVASPARQRELLDYINYGDRLDHIQGWQLLPPGTAQRIKNARHAQIARRMNYNDRIPTLAEQELDYEQANMWYYLCGGDGGYDGGYYGGYDGGYYGGYDGGYYAFGGGGFGRGHRGFGRGMGHAGRGGMGGGHAAGHGGGGHR